MADVFITSSRLDEDRVGPIAERLGSLGHSISRRDTPDAIESAHAVVAIWSRNARASLHVSAEAAYAAERGLLVQMQIDPTSPPPPFDRLPIASFHSEQNEWGVLEDTLAKLAAGGDAPRPTPPRAASLAAIGAPGLVLAALAATLAAHASALSAALSGGLSLDQLGVVSAGALVCAGLCVGVSAWRVVAAVRA